MNLKKLFLEYCAEKKFEINQSQIETIEHLQDYYKQNFKKSFFRKLFNKKVDKIGFYLSGDVGVGKTMILNFVFNQLKEKKLRLHFNEFMINFHDFIFENKSNEKKDGIESFVKDLKTKTELIYFDEFQVTNIVDAMILGKLFKRIFEENIKVFFSSNISIKNLYKDGLQRDQFIPFITVLKKYCCEKDLLIKEDYRTNKNISLERFLSPINESTNFIFNKLFRKVTKSKIKGFKEIEIKGRKITLKNFYEGIARFNFEELCNKNVGSEDYIKIANNCSFIFIDNLPIFDEDKSNQQQRFITLIDILYEKKIPLTIRSEVDLRLFKSSKSLADTFKRTTSRLYELTSINYDYL
jgi:cell division protein ZapE